MVLFSAFLSTASLLWIWRLLHALSGLQEKVVIERDLASGWRTAGFFIAQGIILGGAGMGDWVSTTATLMDFLKGAWPALILVGMAATVEMASPLDPKNHFANTVLFGLTPAVIYIAAAIGSFLAWR